jgi:hypothetical protein
VAGRVTDRALMQQRLGDMLGSGGQVLAGAFTGNLGRSAQARLKSTAFAGLHLAVTGGLTAYLRSQHFPVWGWSMTALLVGLGPLASVRHAAGGRFFVAVTEREFIVAEQVSRRTPIMILFRGPIEALRLVVGRRSGEPLLACTSAGGGPVILHGRIRREFVLGTAVAPELDEVLAAFQARGGEVAGSTRQPVSAVTGVRLRLRRSGDVVTTPTELPAAAA